MNLEQGGVMSIRKQLTGKKSRTSARPPIRKPFKLRPSFRTRMVLK
jgi:hypothetical protein